MTAPRATPATAQVRVTDDDATEPLGQLLTHAEVARRIRMSESWLYASDIPVVHIGSARRYDPREVDAWVATHKNYSLLEGRK